MPKAIIFSISLFLGSISFGQTVLLDEDFSNGIPSTWAVIDADGNTPHSSMSQFTNAWIYYTDSGDSSAASTSYYENASDQSEDYLILPKMSLATFTKLSWSARSVDASYPDGYYVLVSTTDSLTTSFSDTLLTVLTESFQWNRKSVMLDTMGFANQDVYIAFRNFTTNGFILELDDILIEASDFASSEELTQSNLTFYPNPATSSINIDLDGQFNAQIFSMDGKLLIQSDQQNINTADLKSGKYILRVNSEELLFNEVLIIE